MPWVYILRCSDDSLYIGHTDDVVAREATHNAGNGSHFLIGIIAGGVSLLVYSQRLTAFSFVRGASLVLAPLGAGLVMELLGRLLLARGYVRLALFTFKGGFWFALGMALLRFAYVEIG